MKPIVKYRGGKSREIQNILPFIPEFTGRYIEPFFGGGALYFYLEPQRAIINDINSKLMNFYEGVQTDFDNLHEELVSMEEIYSRNRKEFEKLKKKNPDKRVLDRNEEFYYTLRDMYNGLREKRYSDAALYFFINKTAYSGMLRFNAKGEYNVPYGRYKNLNANLVTREHHDLLSRTQIFNGDYSSIFRMARANDFMFLDPPYDCIFSDYGNTEYKEGFTEEDHRKLARHFFALRCPAIMVISRTPLIDELYGNHVVGRYQKNYAVNIRNRFQSEAVHYIVRNHD